MIHGPISQLSTGLRTRLSALYAGRAPPLEAPKWARRFSTAKASFRTRLARGQRLLVGLVPQGRTELNNARPLRTGARSSVLADAGCRGGRCLQRIVQRLLFGWRTWACAFRKACATIGIDKRERE